MRSCYKYQQAEVVSLVERVVKKPRFYKISINDSKDCPIDFFAAILQSIFHLENDESYKRAMNIKVSGFEALGIFTRDVAETKVAAGRNYADCMNLNFDYVLERVEENNVIEKS